MQQYHHYMHNTRIKDLYIDKLAIKLKSPFLFLQPFVLADTKLWPSVGRIDDVHGDKNLVCSCPPMDSYVSPNLVSDRKIEDIVSG